MRPGERLAGGALFALALAVYLPGLPGGFAFDDYHTIVDNASLALPAFDAASLLDAALSTDTGPLKRPLAMLSFAANRSLGGLAALSFKLTNIAIHALNALLVFVLLRRIAPLLGAAGRTPGAGVAWFAAALWAAHPLNLTTVLYVVQRMTSLSATFMLLALVVYAGARARECAGERASRATGWAVGGLGVVALLVKETALLLPLYLLALEAMVFRFRGRAGLRRGVIAAAALGGLALLTLWVLEPQRIAAAYAGREFDLGERLLTESRVLLLYLRLLLAPDLSLLGLFHDDFAVSRGLFAPATTAAALLVLAVMAAATLWRGRPYVAFGCAWFLLGHVLESSVYPLELVHEHRNYLPGIGVLLMGVMAVDEWLQASGRAGLRAVAGFVVVALFAAVTVVRAMVWAEVREQAEYDAAHHPRSSRSLYEVARVRLEQAADGADPELRAAGVAALARAANLAPRSAMPVTALLNTAIKDGDARGVDTALARALRLPEAAAQVDVLEGVVRCQTFGACPPAPQVVAGLADAVLGSAREPATRRRAVEWLAIYYLRVLGDRDAAVDMLRDLVGEAPRDAALATHLAEALAACGRQVEARMVAGKTLRALPWHAAWSERAVWKRLTTVTGLPANER